MWQAAWRESVELSVSTMAKMESCCQQLAHIVGRQREKNKLKSEYLLSK